MALPDIVQARQARFPLLNRLGGCGPASLTTRRRRSEQKRRPDERVGDFRAEHRQHEARAEARSWTPASLYDRAHGAQAQLEHSQHWMTARIARWHITTSLREAPRALAREHALHSGAPLQARRPNVTLHCAPRTWSNVIAGACTRPCSFRRNTPSP
jgi:hypothetical protein